MLVTSVFRKFVSLGPPLHITTIKYIPSNGKATLSPVVIKYPVLDIR